MWNVKQVAIIFFLLLASASLQARSAKVPSPLQSLQMAVNTPSEKANSCQDFLNDWGQKPEELSFIDCQQVVTPEGDRLIAVYTAAGADAIAVEAALKQKFRMAPLQPIGGIWQPVFANEKGQLQPGSGEFVNDKGDVFEVVMRSEKTAVERRQDWAEVGQFEVRIIQHY